MEALNRISIGSDQLGRDTMFSPEYWISQRSTRASVDGVTLDAFASIGNHGTSKMPESGLVLDTGNADRGLLNLKALGSESKGRVSHKKVVPEGAVIISRLRPYLRQVAYLPRGIYERLGVTSILCSTEFYVICPKNQNQSIAFLVPWLLSKDVQTVLDQATTGGHHPRFDESLLKRLSIPTKLLNEQATISVEVERLVAASLDAQLGIAALVDAVR